MALSPCGGLSPAFPFPFPFSFFLIFNLLICFPSRLSPLLGWVAAVARLPVPVLLLLPLLLRFAVRVSRLPRCSLPGVRVRHLWWWLPFPVAGFSVPRLLLSVVWAVVLLLPVLLLWFVLWRLRLPRFGFVFRVEFVPVPPSLPAPGFPVVPAPGLSVPWLLVWVSRCWCFCQLGWCLLRGGVVGLPWVAFWVVGGGFCLSLSPRFFNNLMK